MVAYVDPLGLAHEMPRHSHSEGHGGHAQTHPELLGIDDALPGQCSQLQVEQMYVYIHTYIHIYIYI